MNEQQWQSAQIYEPLPIFASTREALRRALSSRQVHFDLLADIANKDPALCWHLQRRVSQKSEQQAQKIYSAYQCFALLGMQESVDLIKHLPVIDEQNEQSKAYLDQLHIALFSAQLVQKLAYTTEPSKAQSLHWHTLLARAPLWHLSWLYPQSSQQFQALLENRVTLMEANQRVFGQNSESKWLQLAKEMKLPKQVIELYNPKQWPELSIWKALLKTDPRKANVQDKAVIQGIQDPNCMLHSANCLVMAQQSIPEYKKGARWTNINAHILGQEPYEVLKTVRNVQLSLAHQGMDLFALGLHKLAAPAQPVALKASRNQETTAQKLSPKSINYLYALVNQFDQPKAHFQNWLALMHAILDGIKQGVELEVGGIMLKDKYHNHISMTYRLEHQANELLEGLKIDYHQTGLFNKLMNKPGFIHLTEDTHSSYLRPYSQRVIQAIPKHACLMSIHSGSTPLGVVIGGTHSSTISISKNQQQAFKALCLKASYGLETLKKKPKKRHS